MTDQTRARVIHTDDLYTMIGQFGDAMWALGIAQGSINDARTVDAARHETYRLRGELRDLLLPSHRSSRSTVRSMVDEIRFRRGHTI